MEKIIDSYQENAKEVDYRYSLLKKESNLPYNEETRYTKMKEIGKGSNENVTILEVDSGTESFDLKYSKLRIEARGSFSSIRANTCLVKGRWCYEVKLLTNRLFQIGWCQLNTPFKAQDGVGDDPTSYSYDGFRKLKWHSGKAEYGKSWEIGDIIGVCIDLNEKYIEFFQNGESLGKAFENIPTGENLAYFPGLSLSKNEKAVFNFGSQALKYEYPGFNPIDIPFSKYSNSMEISKTCFDLIKKYILPIYDMKDISLNSKITLADSALNFISNVSFRDRYIFNEIIVPFLCDIILLNDERKYTQTLNNFFDNIFFFRQDRVELAGSLFENLAFLIEDYALTGFSGISVWENLMTIFLVLVKNTRICQLWIESRNYSDCLSLIFTSNFIKLNNLIEYFDRKKDSWKNKNILMNPRNMKKFSSELKEEYMAKLLQEGYSKYDHKVNLVYIQIIQFFLEDNRIFTHHRKTYTLKSIVLDVWVKNIKNSSQSPEIMPFILAHNAIKPNEYFIKNFYFNLLEIQANDCYNRNLDSFTIEPWLSRARADSLYVDEVGIGGTISHVTSEYNIHLDKKLRDKELASLQYNQLFHRIITLTSSYIIPVLKNMSKFFDTFPTTNFNDYRQEKLQMNVDDHFRVYLNLFTPRNQVQLYSFGYFLINWITYLIKQNKYILYFIPKSVMNIPFEIFKFLNTIKSPLIKETENTKEANSKYSVFNKENLNDFTYQIIYFYSLLFNDSTIANPELKETFMHKMAYFIRKKRMVKIFNQHHELLELLLKGLLKYMSVEGMYDKASDMIVKIIKPICFGEKTEKVEKMKLIEVTKKFFEDNNNVFLEFMDNYNKLINQAMTDYTISLTEAAHKILNVNVSSNRRSQFREPFENAEVVIKKLMNNFLFMNDLMKIFEFLLTSYPNEFFDINSINFSRFSNFLKNLSSRILDKGYTEWLLKLLETYRPGKSIDYYTQFAHSVIGIILNIYEHKNSPNFQEFINYLISQSDFDVEPFYAISTHVKKDENLLIQLNKYKEIIDYFASLKTSKAQKKMSEKEWEEATNNELMCILCYSNNMNRELVPCGHGKIY